MVHPSQRFYHDGLGGGSIRLLQPVAIENRTLVYTIAHFPRHNPPVYTAVSYIWDINSLLDSIILNGDRFDLHRNLKHCLRCLGQHALHQTVPWTHLWVDAICIDQTNDLERAHQVRLMDRVYHNANVVSVWLGLPRQRESVDWDQSLVHLANLPYWSRFWVIQEFLLAQRVQVFFGMYGIDSDRFKRLIDVRIGEQEYLETILDGPQELWAAWPLIAGRGLRRVRLSLSALVLRHGTSQCNDPKDRVFALLGLVHENERRQLERFFPDYTISHDSVVVIALAHMRLTDADSYARSLERLLVGLGVVSKTRQVRLANQAAEFDYLSNQFPDDSQDCDTRDSDSLRLDEQAFRERVRLNSQGWHLTWRTWDPLRTYDEPRIQYGFEASCNPSSSLRSSLSLLRSPFSSRWDRWELGRSRSLPHWRAFEVIFAVLYILAHVSIFVSVLHFYPRT